MGAQQHRKRVSQVESMQRLGGLRFFLVTKQREARSNCKIWPVPRAQARRSIHFGFRDKKMAKLVYSVSSSPAWAIY